MKGQLRAGMVARVALGSICMAAASTCVTPAPDAVPAVRCLCATCPLVMLSCFTLPTTRQPEEAIGPSAHSDAGLGCGAPGSNTGMTATRSPCAVWELFMGEPLYERLSKVQIMFGVMSQDMRPQFPSSAPAWLADLACQCWAASPAARSAFP